MKELQTISEHRRHALKYEVFVELSVEKRFFVRAINEEEAKMLAKNRMTKKRKTLERSNNKIVDCEIIDCLEVTSS